MLCLNTAFLILAQAEAAATATKATGFWDVVNQNMSTILTMFFTALASIGVALAAAGKLIWAIASNYIERRNKRLTEDAEREAAESKKRCDLLDKTIEHIPHHTRVLSDTCKVLQEFHAEHVETKEAAIPVLEAVIAMGENPNNDIPSDVLEDLKLSRDRLAKRDRDRAERDAAREDARETRRRKSEHPNLATD